MRKGDKLMLHQHQYVLTKLRDRDLLEGHGKWNLPVTPEGKLVPEEKDELFPGRKKQAQKEVGTLMWLTIKTRPDIGPVVGTASSCIAHNPSETIRLCDGVWKYLAVTPDVGMILTQTCEDRDTRYVCGGAPQVLVATDASFAPGWGKEQVGNYRDGK